MGVISTTLPVGFISIVSWVLSQLKRRISSGDSEFMLIWAFLYFRFKTEAYYYILLVLLRGFICSVIPIVPNATGQIVLMLMAITFFFSISCHVFPWKSYYANVMDSFITFFIILAIGMAPFFVE